MKRYVSIWLTHWSTDRWRRRASAEPDSGRPLVLTLPGPGGLRLSAVDAAAAAESLYPGQRLTDARALVPALRAASADPLADAEALGRLADWCGRYTPWSAVDGEDGVVLDITGCAHLFGGEAALVADLGRRLAGFGVTARAAMADTPAAAWAWARFGEGAILPAGKTRSTLAKLPVEALRLDAARVEQLRRLGLRRIGDLLDLPRAPLVARLGSGMLRRLDRALGEPEAISPRRPPSLWRARLAFAEAIARREDLDRSTSLLLADLCAALEADGRGARRLELALYRVDGTAQILDIGTSRPTRDPAHLARLFAERLGTVEPGFGIETMILGAVATDELAPSQIDLAPPAPAAESLAPVIDRLQNRLGRNAVVRLIAVDSHLPERAVVVAPAAGTPNAQRWPTERERPIQLLAAPEPVDVGGPQEAPASFRWRRTEHRVALAEGPERIAPEWWRPRGGAETRDYYWLEDESGRRYWVYRVTDSARWYLHGLFA